MRLGQEQVFGPLKLVEAGFGFRIGDPTQWRLRHALSGGGALMDVGIYAIQAARYATGEEPVSISAQEVKTDPVKFREVDETLTWQMKFPSGALATCATSYNANFNRLHAIAEGGSFTINSAYGYDGQELVTSQGPFEAEPANMFAAEIDNFVTCIQNDEQSLVSGEEGLRDMKIIEAIYASIREGREVALQ
jgi:predicted dehydrogenase